RSAGADAARPWADPRRSPRVRRRAVGQPAARRTAAAALGLLLVRRAFARRLPASLARRARRARRFRAARAARRTERGGRTGRAARRRFCRRGGGARWRTARRRRLPCAAAHRRRRATAGGAAPPSFRVATPQSERRN